MKFSKANFKRLARRVKDLECKAEIHPGENPRGTATIPAITDLKTEYRVYRINNHNPTNRDLMYSSFNYSEAYNYYENLRKEPLNRFLQIDKVTFDMADTFVHESFNYLFVEREIGNRQEIWNDGFEAGKKAGIEEGKDKHTAEKHLVAGNSYKIGYDAGIKQGFADGKKAMLEEIKTILPDWSLGFKDGGQSGTKLKKNGKLFCNIELLIGDSISDKSRQLLDTLNLRNIEERIKSPK